MLLPFGKPLTELLHHISHTATLISAQDNQYNHDHGHYHADDHSHAHEAESNSESHDHAHKVLNFLNAFIDFATDTDNEEYIGVKMIDKHVKVDQSLNDTPFYNFIKIKFNPPSARMLLKHTFATIIPPDMRL